MRRGAWRIVVAAGGSATTDGGLGAIAATFSEMNTIDEVNLFVEKLSSILKK
ncbi:glycerate kinase [Nocardia rhamnosiphila]